MSKKLLCVSCERYESFLECIKRTKGWSSADGDAEEVHNPASERRGYFISALSRFILEIPPAKLNIAISHMRGWSQVLPATRSAARMKGKSEWEKDTELEKQPRELAGDIGWVGVCIVASASELNCCHPHTFKCFRGSSSSKPVFPGCRWRSQWEDWYSVTPYSYFPASQSHSRGEVALAHKTKEDVINQSFFAALFNFSLVH